MSESYYRNFTQKRFRKPNLVTHTHYTQFSPPPSSRHYHTVPGVPSIMGSPSPFIVHTTRDGSSRKVGRHFDSFNLSNFFLANFRHGCGGQKAKRVLIQDKHVDQKHIRNLVVLVLLSSKTIELNRSKANNDRNRGKPPSGGQLGDRFLVNNGFIFSPSGDGFLTAPNFA